MKLIVFVICLNFITSGFAQVNNDSLILDKLITKLEDSDQKYRLQTDSIKDSFGVDSPQWKNLWKLIQNQDSLNFLEVKSILNDYNICELNNLDKKYSSTIFLVLQHSGLKNLSKYSSEIKKAYKNNCVTPHKYSLMIDRIKIFKNRKQIYGTQIGMNKEDGKYYVLKLKKPCSVDSRRAKIKLPPLSTYTEFYEIKWDCNIYKKSLKNYSR